MSIEKNIKEKVLKQKRILLELASVFLMIVILSLTIGRVLLADQQPSLYSFSFIHFAGYLFFLLMPVEVVIPFYILEGHSKLIIFSLAILTALAAQFLDYCFGKLASDRVINNLIGKERYQKTKRRIELYGYSTIFFFNLFPLSSPIVVFVAGILRLPLLKVLFYSATGLLLKYGVLVYLS